MTLLKAGMASSGFLLAWHTVAPLPRHTCLPFTFGPCCLHRPPLLPLQELQQQQQRLRRRRGGGVAMVRLWVADAVGRA